VSFRRRLLSTVAALVLLVLADFGAHRVRRQFDLTSENSQTLSDETKLVLGALKKNVKATIFYARGDPDRVTASTLLLRYRRLSSRVSFRILDPNQSASEASRLGLDPVAGGIALEQGGRVERAGTATEQDITAAIARLERGKPSSVCLTRGHGESDPDSTLGEGFKAATEVLLRNGYELRSLDLLTRSEIPSSCEAVVIANPTADLGPANQALSTYFKNAGRGVILTDPIAPLDWKPILEPYGLKIERGIVLEADPDRRFPDDPTRPVIFSYNSPNSIVNRLPPTFFPGVQGVLPTKEDISGLVTSELARTSERSYLEREPLTAKFDEGKDIAGPITLVAAADLSGNFGGKVIRTRLVVFGDSDFATNSFINEAGNSTFLVRALDWAIIEEDLVTVSTNLPKVRPLELTEGRILYARLLLAVVVPLLFLVGGSAMWLVRRRR
jgi:hypothetical protein